MWASSPVEPQPGQRYLRNCGQVTLPDGSFRSWLMYTSWASRFLLQKPQPDGDEDSVDDVDEAEPGMGTADEAGIRRAGMMLMSLIEGSNWLELNLT